MKRSRVPCLVCVVLLGFSLGCLEILGIETVRGSGRVSEESHTFTGLAGVELATRGELEIRLGDTERLQVTADDNLHDYFAITSDGGTLKIATEPGINLRPSRPIRYTLTVREIEFIALSSSGDALAPTLRADRFEIRLDSSGDLSLDGIEADSVDVRLRSSGDLSVDDLRAGSLAVRISSSGDVRIDGGEVDSLDITINSSGDYRGESVRSARATVALSSSGNARLWADESLDATLNSSGSLSYRGDPEVTARANSSGRIRPVR